MRVLVLARNYPNNVTGILGLWVERLVRHSVTFCRPTVIAPVPYCPPIPGLPRRFSRFRSVERYRLKDAVPVHHPRFLIGPGYSLHRFEPLLYSAAIANLTRRLWSEAPFDLIHAHFTYPDGVVAAQLAKYYGVPFVVTEHAPWDVWAGQPRILKRVIHVAERSAYHISVSHATRRSVERHVGKRDNLIVLPNGVDCATFKPRADTPRIRNQVLFAGAVRPVKGVDLLLQAFRMLVDRGRDATLLVAGEAFYGNYQREEYRLRRMTEDLQLRARVKFLGKQTPAEVAALMATSALVVLPSRLESFGSVLVEALACGTPVVGTRCGGPEDIVTDDVGVLVPPEDPEALARGIEHVLDYGAQYSAERLSSYAKEKFGLESVGRMLSEVYENACAMPTRTAAAIG